MSELRFTMLFCSCIQKHWYTLLQLDSVFILYFDGGVPFIICVPCLCLVSWWHFGGGADYSRYKIVVFLKLTLE